MAIDDLGVVSISLSLHLVDIVLLEDLRDILGLMHLHHVRVDGGSSIGGLVSLEGIFLPRSHDSLLGVG